MSTTLRIDVHQHVVPPFWAKELRTDPSGTVIPPWSPESAIDSMDSQEFPALLFRHGAVIGSRGFAESQGFCREPPDSVRQRLPLRTRRHRRVFHRRAGRL
jgi:hypothetical protein